MTKVLSRDSQWTYTRNKAITLNVKRLLAITFTVFKDIPAGLATLAQSCYPSVAFLQSGSILEMSDS